MKKSKKRKPRLITVIISLLVILLIIWIIPNNKYNGLDISRHNDGIDWNSVKEDSNIEFCIVKATEGGNWVDPLCLKLVANSNSIGLKTGLYHYFRTNVSGIEQFENFNKILKQCKFQVIPVIDVESNLNKLDSGNATDKLKEMIECFKNEYGYYPIIYLGSWDSLKTYSTIKECKWWVRCIGFRNFISSSIKQVAVEKKYNTEIDLDYCSNIDDILIPNT